MNAQATRLWARFFSPGNSSNILINIPADWANFFTILLLSPSNFTWTRQLLLSKLTHLLLNNNGEIEFSLPSACLDNDLSYLTVSEDVEAAGSNNPAPSRKRSLKRPTALVDTEVRRSPRIRNSNQGFKHQGFPNKRCFACGTEPPILKKRRNQKVSFWFL